MKDFKPSILILIFPVRLSPERTCRVIMAYAVLHNIGIIMREPEPDDVVYDGNDAAEDPYHGPQQGRLVRDHYVNRFFTY